jgi:hypothetical protein
MAPSRVTASTHDVNQQGGVAVGSIDTGGPQK